MSELAIICRPQGGSDEPLDICVAGPITRTTTPALRDHLRRLIATRPSPSSGSRLRLNLSGCTSINVDGMLALSVAQQAARSRGGDLHLVDVPLPIERQLRQHNFDDLLLEPTPDQHRDRRAPLARHRHRRVTVRLRRTTPWAITRTGARARRPRTVGLWELARLATNGRMFQNSATAYALTRPRCRHQPASLLD